jgi:hypothetical protein
LELLVKIHQWEKLDLLGSKHLVRKDWFNLSVSSQQQHTHQQEFQGQQWDQLESGLFHLIRW